MSFRLLSSDGDHAFELRSGSALVLGRALTSDLPLVDPTISRRHAQFVVDGGGVEVQDLGSSNGTFVNGIRVERARLAAGDQVTVGRVSFELFDLAEDALAKPTSKERPRTLGGPTIVRQRPVPNATLAFVQALKASGGHPVVDTPPSLPEHERVRTKLALLLEVSKALTRAVDIDALLGRIASYVFQILDVDRLSILLVDEHADLVPRLARDRDGATLGRTVPLSIARTAIQEKVAILSDNTSEDERFTGQSAVVQQVRSAVCVPLVGSENRVIGVLYVDNLTTAHRFSEEDLDFIIAFGGIVAVAIENSQFAERSRHEALVRSNFERFFAPGLAARIAAAPDAITLGGDRRSVAVLFADIRGFTPIAAAMAPDDTAHLLTDFFTEMTECVFRHGGTLDKFMGDAVMAQWGAPISSPDDADRALQAAIDMMAAIEPLNARSREQGRPEVQIGIGLNYGDVFAGTIGSDRRLEFTIIGDTVNTANRLCAWAERGEILVSEAMYQALHCPDLLERRAPLTLRGKAEPVAVYRVAR
jgi:adenylate cyclase